MPDQDLVALARSLEPLVEVKPAASEVEIAEIEMALGVRLPTGLRAFLSQSNGASIGVKLDSGELISNASSLVWSLDKILAENRTVSVADSGRTRVLYFADAGADGILFGHPVGSSGVVRDEVVVWHPIEDRLSNLAPSFRDFLEGWLTGSVWV